MMDIIAIDEDKTENIINDNDYKSDDDCLDNKKETNDSVSFGERNNSKTNFVENSVCKIIVNEKKENCETGTGFVCKIPDPDNKENIILVLISCHHVINIIESGGKYFTNNKNDNNNKNDDEIEFIKIKYNINGKDYNNELFLANRRIWYDNELDFIFIEIKNEEYKLDKDSLFNFKK